LTNQQSRVAAIEGERGAATIPISIASTGLNVAAAVLAIIVVHRITSVQEDLGSKLISRFGASHGS